MKQLLLISPANKRLCDRAKSRSFPAVGLPIIANLTPPEWNVTIVDEGWGDEIDFDNRYDLVGIGMMTGQAPRAYQIATRFRNRGTRVVFGGSHPSVCADEALQYGDSVVIGEAEHSWPQLLRDLEAGSLERTYTSDWPAEGWYSPPRRDLVKTNVGLGVRPMLASRGCPHRCTFCSVHHVFGRRYRFRPVEDVVAEVEQLAKSGGRVIVFLDDNIMGNREWAKELFRRLTPLKIKWGGQTTLGAAQDQEMMRLASRSGCFSMFVGIESVNRGALKGVKKSFNQIERYRDWCRIYHDNGIVILAGVVFGFDEDDRHVFELTVEVLDRLGVGFPNFTLLIPLPGTDIYRQMKAEGRLLTDDWERYTGSEVVFRPRLMTPEQLQEGSDWADFQFYKPSGIARRFLSDNWQHPLYYWGLGFAYWYKCFEHTRGRAIRLGREKLEREMEPFGLVKNGRRPVGRIIESIGRRLGVAGLP